MVPVLLLNSIDQYNLGEFVFYGSSLVKAFHMITCCPDITEIFFVLGSSQINTARLKGHVGDFRYSKLGWPECLLIALRILALF